MKVVPFDLHRDFDLYVEGDTDAFTSSFPGVAVSPTIASEIETWVRTFNSSEYTEGFTLIDSVPLGFVVVSLRSFYVFSQGYVDSIYVSEASRGRGASRLLLQEAERWSRSMGARSMTLDVSLANANAVSAYHACGFAETRIQMEKIIV